MLSGAFLNRSVEVREMTLRSPIRESLVRISSWMPSAKYAFALSSLRFSNGRTAMLFSGTRTVALLAVSSERGDAVGDDARLKKIKELATRATADTTKATTSRGFGHRGLTGRTPAGLCFHLPRLSFSGTCGLPRLSLWRLKRCSL